MSEQPYPPHATASLDQHFAAVAEELDLLIGIYRQISTGCDRTRCLTTVVGRLVDPRKPGGEISHADHVATLANMLTVAIDRLPGGQ